MTTQTMAKAAVSLRVGMWTAGRVVASLLTVAVAVRYLLAAWAGVSRSAGGSDLPFLQTLTEPYVLAGMGVAGFLLLWAGIAGMINYRVHRAWANGQRLTVAACAFGMAVYGLGMLGASGGARATYLEITWQNMNPFLVGALVAGLSVIVAVAGLRRTGRR